MNPYLNGPLTSQFPVDDGALHHALDYITKRFGLSQENCLPAAIVSYTRTGASNLAVVQPLIQWVRTDGELLDRPQLINVPVFNYGGGGFHINFPLKNGDFGWIVAADRDIDLFKQNLKKTKPNSGRAHDFADSWFIPDIIRNYTIAGEDTNAVVFQHSDSQSRVAIDSAAIRIVVGNTRIVVTSSDVSITAQTAEINASSSASVTTQTFSVNAPAINLTGAVTIAGPLACGPGAQGSGGTMTGNFNLTGTMTATGEGTFNGHTVSAHVHADPQGGQVGPPIG